MRTNIALHWLRHLAAVALAFGTTAAMAGLVLIDNTATGTLIRETRAASTNGYPGGILARIDVGASNVLIEQFGIFGRQEAAGNLQFAIYDNAATPNRLYLSGQIATAAGAADQWYDSDLLSLNLLAGQTYWFGVLSDQRFTYDWSTGGPVDSANGLTSIDSNGNFGNFGADPQVFDRCCGVQQGLRVIGPDGNTVPEPASLALTGLGLVAAAAVRRRRANLA